MSRPHIIVSAVHELEDEDPEDFWTDANVREVVSGFEEERDHKNNIEWRFSEAQFQPCADQEPYLVETSYHSRRGFYVAEVIIQDVDPQKVKVSGLEDTIERINMHFDRDFTLETYYWYDGVDRPGAVPR